MRSGSITRRALLGGVAAVATSGAVAGCSNDSGAAPDGTASLRFTWWGNDGRHEITQQAIDVFTSEHPDITIEPEAVTGGAYWDKLAVNVAARDMADVVQMDEQYLREYSDRGAFLDLHTVDFDTSKFAPGTADAGVVDGKLVAINNGINAPTFVASPTLFEEAGVPLPDDTTWTWDDLAEIAAELTAALPDGVYGTSSFTSCDYAFTTFLRQRGKELFLDTELGFEAADLTAWFTMELELRKSGAIPTAEEVTEDESLSLDQTAITKGLVAMCSNIWTNQVNLIDTMSGENMKILRLPTMTGNAADAQLWFKPSQFFSVAADTPYPEAAGQFVDFLVNSPKAGEILGDDRGVPPNTELRAALEDGAPPEKQKVFDYLAALEPELGSQPSPPPIGTSDFADILKRYGQDILFELQTPQEAGPAMFAEVQRGME